MKRRKRIAAGDWELATDGQQLAIGPISKERRNGSQCVARRAQTKACNSVHAIRHYRSISRYPAPSALPYSEGTLRS